MHMSEEFMESKSKHKTINKLNIFLVLLLGISLMYIWKTTNSEKNVIMTPYMFINDIGGLVSAKGSWISADTELSIPFQTVEINCWQNIKYCFLNYAELNEDSVLSAYTQSHEISQWTEDTIETKPYVLGMGCVEYQLNLNRRSQTVTQTRRTLRQDGICESIQKEPITMTLVDGSKRINQPKK